MRYTIFFLAIMILLGITLSGQSRAEGSKDGYEPVERPPVQQPPPAHTEKPVDPAPAPEEQAALPEPAPEQTEVAESEMDHPCREIEAEEPYEACWYEHPWEMWRHFDSSILDYDAMQFLGTVRTIAVLPFVDNTEPTMYGQSRLNEMGGPGRIVDDFAAVFMSRGYLVIPPCDTAAALMHYLSESGRSGGTFRQMSSEYQNNSLYFNVLPERSIAYFVEKVSGLGDYDPRNMSNNYYLLPEDIKALAELLGADCIVRGYVNEFALDRFIDNDWRTYLPPFLGVINPDRMATAEVTCYIYDGRSGELVWNSSTSVRREQNWPLFNSESELLGAAENEVTWSLAGRILPDWYDYVRSHPEWMPCEMWGAHDGRDFNHRRFEERPDWLNPHRNGWHDEYRRCNFNIGDLDGNVQNEPYRFRYRNLTHAYDQTRDWLAHEED